MKLSDDIMTLLLARRSDVPSVQAAIDHLRVVVALAHAENKQRDAHMALSALENALPITTFARQSFAKFRDYHHHWQTDWGAALEPGRDGECRFRARRDDNRIMTLIVVPRHDGVRLGSIEVRASLAMP